MPRRCLHGVHPSLQSIYEVQAPLPRRCLHGVHPAILINTDGIHLFASALPARGASAKADKLRHTIL